MNINALAGMGPNGSTTILLYLAEDDHRNAHFVKVGLYATRDFAMKVARRLVDMLKDVAKARKVVTDDDIDLVRRRSDQAVLRLGY
jgi:uncharacterized protein (UPF0264 family)